MDARSSPRARRASVVGLVLALASLAGCPDTTPVASGRCDHAGDACQLPNGTLGLCSESLAATCPSPPCLACTPQH